MNYKEIEVENSQGEIAKHIVIDNGDGSFKSFPADESNPEYVAFLLATAAPAKTSKAKATVDPEVSEAE
jgi:hypothetical protein